MGGVLASAMKNKEDEALRAKIGLDGRQVDRIVESWAEVKKFGTEKAGIILFKRLFIAAPETFQTFVHFRDIPNWEESREFKHHCKIVMNIIGSAVGLLRDPESLDSTLEYLGYQHEGFTITQAHFDIMGVELIHTLREAIGNHLTPEVEQAWVNMYVYITKIIVKGMHQMEDGMKKTLDT